MVNYECSKCNKIFRDKYNYERHVNKQTSCDIKNIFRCDSCNKEFLHKHGLKYHILHNVCVNTNIKKMEIENKKIILSVLTIKI